MTGIKEAYADVERFPSDVTAALRRGAEASANRAWLMARRLVRVATGETQAAIGVVEDEARKQFLVEVDTDVVDPPMKAIWIEFGTKYMQARPFMRPARDAEDGRYQADQERAVTAVAKRLERR